MIGGFSNISGPEGPIMKSIKEVPVIQYRPRNKEENNIVSDFNYNGFNSSSSKCWNIKFFLYNDNGVCGIACVLPSILASIRKQKKCSLPPSKFHSKMKTAVIKIQKHLLEHMKYDKDIYDAKVHYNPHIVYNILIKNGVQKKFKDYGDSADLWRHILLKNLGIAMNNARLVKIGYVDSSSYSQTPKRGAGYLFKEVYDDEEIKKKRKIENYEDYFENSLSPIIILIKKFFQTYSHMNDENLQIIQNIMRDKLIPADDRKHIENLIEYFEKKSIAKTNKESELFKFKNQASVLIHTFNIGVRFHPKFLEISEYSDCFVFNPWEYFKKIDGNNFRLNNKLKCCSKITKIDGIEYVLFIDLVTLCKNEKYSELWNHLVLRVGPELFSSPPESFKIENICEDKLSRSSRIFEFYNGNKKCSKTYIWKHKKNFVKNICEQFGLPDLTDKEIRNNEENKKLFEIVMKNFFKELIQKRKVCGVSWKDIFESYLEEEETLKNKYIGKGFELYREKIHKEDVGYQFKVLVGLTDKQYETSCFFFNPNSCGKAALSPLPKYFVGKKWPSLFQCLSKIKKYRKGFLDGKVNYEKIELTASDLILAYAKTEDSFQLDIQKFFERMKSLHPNLFPDCQDVEFDAEDEILSTIDPRYISGLGEKRTVKCFVQKVLVASDQTNNFNTTIDERKGISGVWFKFLTRVPGFINSKLNHHLLALFEGKENFQNCKNVYEKILKPLKDLEDSIYVDSDKVPVKMKVFFSGDMKNYLILLGMNGCGGHCFCSRCKFNRKDASVDDYLRIHGKKKIEEMIRIGEFLESGVTNESTKNPLGQKYIPIIRNWALERWTFCALHCKLSFLRSVLKFLMDTCLLGQIMNERLKKYQEIRTSLSSILQLLNPSKILNETQKKSLEAFARKWGLTFTPGMSTENLRKLIKTFAGEEQKKFQKYMDTQLTVEDDSDIPLIFRLQNLFRKKGIGVSFFNYVFDQKISCIGKHWEQIMDILDDINETIGNRLGSGPGSKLQAIKDLDMVMRTINAINPTTLNRGMVIREGLKRVKSYLEITGVKPFHYCHIIVHIIADLEKYGSSGIFSCASIEMMNSDLKNNLSKTNKNKGSNGKKDYLFQILERYVEKVEVTHLIMELKRRQNETGQQEMEEAMEDEDEGENEE